MGIKEDIIKINSVVKVYSTGSEDIILDESSQKDDLLRAALLMWHDIDSIKARLRAGHRDLHDELFKKVV
jgi:hypothetical protein